MFFFLSKVLFFLITPIAWIILAFLISFFTKKEGRKKLFRNLGIGMLILFSNPFLVNLANQAIEVDPNPISRPYDIGVVLTGMTNPEIEVEGQVQLNGASDRIIESLRLLSNGNINQLIISGGSGTLGKPELRESPALAKLAYDLGIKPIQIIIEEESRNTHQNAQFTKKKLEEINFNGEILLITSASHMRRAAACFRKQNLSLQEFPVDFKGSPSQLTWNSFIPSAAVLDDWGSIIKEFVGYLVYKVMGYA